MYLKICKEGVANELSKTNPIISLFGFDYRVDVDICWLFVFKPNDECVHYANAMDQLITLLFSHHIFASIYSLYQKAWQYASIGELIAIVKAVTYAIVVPGIVQFIVGQDVYFRALGLHGCCICY